MWLIKIQNWQIHAYLYQYVWDNPSNKYWQDNLGKIGISIHIRYFFIEYWAIDNLIKPNLK